MASSRAPVEREQRSGGTCGNEWGLLSKQAIAMLRWYQWCRATHHTTHACLSAASSSATRASSSTMRSSRRLIFGGYRDTKRDKACMPPRSRRRSEQQQHKQQQQQQQIACLITSAWVATSPANFFRFAFSPMIFCASFCSPTFADNQEPGGGDSRENADNEKQ